MDIISHFSLLALGLLFDHSGRSVHLELLRSFVIVIILMIMVIIDKLLSLAIVGWVQEGLCKATLRNAPILTITPTHLSTFFYDESIELKSTLYDEFIMKVRV